MRGALRGAPLFLARTGAHAPDGLPAGPVAGDAEDDEDGAAEKKGGDRAADEERVRLQRARSFVRP
jgi:hypothetical protein